MPTLPHLNQIANILEKDPNSMRIKKVLLCAYMGKWENDANQLKNLDLSQLLQDVYQKYQQLDQFSISLNNILSRLNKKNEYTQVINTILNQVSQLYGSGNQELTTGISKPSITASETVKISPEELNSLSSAYFSNGTTQSTLRGLSGDLYEVRFKIMQHTNPLRAKLVIFSSLEREFNYRDEDWAQLKNHSLDDLLRQLLQAFPNLDRLKSHLYKMAEYLEDIDENIQVVTVILEALTPYYDHRKQSSFLKVEATAREDNATIHYPDPNVSISDPLALQHHSVLQEQFLTPGSLDINESETLHLLQSEQKELHFNIAENIHYGREVTEGNFSDFTSPTVIGGEPDAGDREARNISDLIQRKLRLEQDIKEQINHRVADAIVPLTTILRHLEVSLTDTLKHQPPEVRLEIKYKSLKEFIDLIQAKVEELKTVIDQSEVQEQQKLSQNQTMFTSGGENLEPANHRVNPDQLLELAKQGHAKAIATVISQTFKSKEITALAKSKDGCLHIILESDPVPNQASMSQFVHHKLLNLQIQSIQKVKIYARTPGNKSMAWSQEFIYKATQH